MSLRHLTLLLLAVLALALAACGDDEEEAANFTFTGTTEATATTETEAESAPAPAGEKPEIAKPKGDPPTELVKKDLKKGKGAAAKSGDNVTVHYVGVSWSTGEEFDASWNSGEPFSFQLGQGSVIPGWDQGLVGMREGGQRRLEIPPDLAYGPQGSPPSIGPNETLVFVVDLVSIG
jgi:peptidylprolyl isomerase